MELNRAVALLRKGQVKEADAQLARIQQSDPGYLTAVLGRAQVAVDGQHLADADRMVTDVLKRQDLLPEAHDMKGLLLLLQKNNSGARKEFARAVELQPHYVTPRVYLAVLDRTSGDYAGAAAEYKALTGIAPHLPAGYLGESESLMLMRREGEALAVLEAWKTADPNSQMPYQVLARVYLADGKPQPALQQVHAALQRHPHDAVTLALLGDAYEAGGDLPSARKAYDAALAADATNAEATLGLGGLEAGEGQTAKAMVHFRQVLSRDPGNAIACNDVAWLLATTGGDLQEALRLAERAVQSNSAYADARDTLGWVHYRRGEFAAAVRSLKEAKALAPANPDVAAHLGMAYARSGNKRDALLELKRALSSGQALANRGEVEQAARQLSAS